MISSETFWDKVADKYSKAPIRNMEGYEATLERVRAHLKPTDKVLELGCGTGTTALKLAPYADHILATDIAGNMVAIGEQKARDQGITNVSFKHATVHDESLAPGSFDVVTGFNLLHLVEDLPEAIARARELVKPDGLLITKSACLGHSIHWRVMAFVMQLVGKAPYVRFMSVKDLESAITGAGFEIIETGTYPAKSSSHFVVARKV